MGLTDWADDLLDGVDRARHRAASWLEPSLRIGVTGLSGAGKTVFITALAASLMRRGRLKMLAAEADGRIEACVLSPQPDLAVPRFAYEAHMAALRGAAPAWPESTRSISQLRLSLRYRGTGFWGPLTGASVLHLDIVDYPGEWLIDLGLMEQDYAAWSAEALALAESPARKAHAGAWSRALAEADPAAPHDEPMAEALATAYAGYLTACRKAGLSALGPGRLLMPGDLAGSPALTFAPLPRPERAGRRGSLHAEMETRFEAYKRVVVRPFFRDHFAKLDRQVVLVDALGALGQGPRAFADLMAGMTATLGAFRHGANGWLDRLLGQRRIDKLLFVASKADHLHHEQHPQLAALVEAMLEDAAARAAFRGAEIKALALAAIRATAEQEITEAGRRVALVRGRRLPDRKEVAAFPGELPANPAELIAAAEAANPGAAPAAWPMGGFGAERFAPPAWGDRPEDGPPHIRLDQALEFLIGDKLE